MKSEAVNNLVYLAALIGRQGIKEPLLISQNLVKLRKLVATLRLRHENTRTYGWATTANYTFITEGFQKHALELARDIGIRLEDKSALNGEFIIYVNDRKEIIK